VQQYQRSLVTIVTSRRFWEAQGKLERPFRGIGRQMKSPGAIRVESPGLSCCPVPILRGRGARSNAPRDFWGAKIWQQKIVGLRMQGGYGAGSKPVPALRSPAITPAAHTENESWATAEFIAGASNSVFTSGHDSWYRKLWGAGAGARL
jgi:hypothetical protein